MALKIESRWKARMMTQTVRLRLIPLLFIVRTVALEQYPHLQGLMLSRLRVRMNIAGQAGREPERRVRTIPSMQQKG